MLSTLRSESLSAGLGDGSRPPHLEVEGECTYYSPTDDMAMEKVRQGVQLWGGFLGVPGGVVLRRTVLCCAVRTEEERKRGPEQLSGAVPHACVKT